MSLANFITRHSKVSLEPKGVALRFLVQGGAHIGGAACSFVATLVMVRALGQAEFGFVALGQSVVTYALAVTNFGSDVYAMQRTSADRTRLAENLKGVMLVRAALLVPTLLTIAVMCLSGVWERGEQLAIGLFSISVIINIGYPLWAAQALERAPVIAAATFGNQFLNLILVLCAAWFGGGIAAYALAKVAADLACALGMSAWLRRHARLERVRFSPKDFGAFLRGTAPLGVSSLLRSLSLASDLIMLSFYVSAALVGLYAVPFRIFMMIIALSSVYSVVILPTFVRAAGEGPGALGKVLARTNGLPFLSYLCILIAIGVTAPFSLGLLFGSAFGAGALSLQLLMVAAAANFSNRSYRMVMLAANKRVDDMHSTTVATAVNIVAKLVLIPFFGIAGAAGATALGELTLAGLQRTKAMKALRSIDGR